MCAVYCADGTFVSESSKYIAACLTSVSCMLQLSLPHINVLTKCDRLGSSGSIRLNTRSRTSRLPKKG